MNPFIIGDVVIRIVPSHLKGNDRRGLQFFPLPLGEKTTVVDVGPDFVYGDTTGDLPLHVKTLDKCGKVTNK